MKIETRGMYPGVKVHLDPEECEALIQASEKAPLSGGKDTVESLEIFQEPGQLVIKVLNFSKKMGKSIKELLQENPNLLAPRTDAEIAAILAKEAEKAQLQLNAIKAGTKWQKIPKEQLESALLKHVK